MKSSIWRNVVVDPRNLQWKGFISWGGQGEGRPVFNLKYLGYPLER
jgi:hypothetical protein